MRLYNGKLYLISALIVGFLLWLVLVGLSSFNQSLPSWRTQYQELDPKRFNSEQAVYYKMFQRIIEKEAPYKSNTDIDLMATAIVAFSKNIPFFAGVIYTESLKPSRWRKGKLISRYKRWFHFTQKNDGGSPSYGAPKLKYKTIQFVCAKLTMEKPPLSRKIDMSKLEWQIKLMRWSAIYYDYLVKTSKCPIKAMAKYKYGPDGYKMYKKNNPYREPYDVHGNALAKATEYLSMFSHYSLKGEYLFDGPSSKKSRDSNS